MVNKEKLKLLTWKYFWQQKKEEVFKFLKVIKYHFLVIGCFGLFILALIYDIIAYILATFFIICVFIYCIYLIYIWIKSNWNKAEARAKEKLKSKKKNGIKK